MMGCKKCQKVSGILLLLLGLAFLLKDLGVWSFWNISWYSGIFLVLGVCGIAMTTCKDCQAMCKR